MPATILATKLYLPPPRPNAVLRPHLLDLLNDGLAANHRLTLISAPAGYGKTALVSAWVASSHRPTAWLSLDEADSDPTRFLTYLIAALQTIAPQVGTGLANALSSPQPPSTEAILTALLNEVATIQDPFTLVLDDYHVLDSSAVDAALAFLIDHLPPHLHLVITTREDPRLPLPRYRARGQLTELRAADLRFSPAEAANYLNQVMGLNLSTEDIAALETRTEGWIAGLQLAGLSLQGHQDAAGFIQSFTGSHRFVLDYLVEEVLQRQPAGVQRFLLRTSLLDQMCGPLCDAVLRDPSLSAQETLEHLERANLFIAPLDQERRWYRYHHLFGAFLRQRLQAQAASSPADPALPELHLRASQWYEENGSRDQAIRHALAAGDFAQAADLVELAMPAMRRTGQDATLLGWLQALPDEVVRCRPVLSAGYAGALLAAGQPLAAEARLRDAEQWLDAPAGTDQQPTDAAGKRVVVDQEQLRRTPGIIALIRAGQALARGDLPETVRHARRALEFAPDDDHLMRGGAQSQLGLAAWTQGDLETARRMTADGMANVRLAGHISTAISCAIVLADVQTAQGRLREAMGTYEQALRWATAPGAPVLRGAADMHVGLSSLLYEHNDLEAARQHLLASQSLGHLAEQAQNPYRWCAAMARLRQASGDFDGALDLLDQAERQYDSGFCPNVRPLATRKVRVWLAQGRLEQALDWTHQQGLSASDDDLTYLREFDHLTLARVLLVRHLRNPGGGALGEATGLLERLLKAAEEGNRTGSLIQILVLLAMAHQARGALPAALAPLQRALTLAEPEGYVRTFLDEGPGMKQLLRHAAARGVAPNYAGRLLAAFDTDQPTSAAQPLIEPLSERELEVLRLVAQGLSNREIGQRLFLALDTVKGHNRRIFGKLQVKSRTEAIARAGELGLLGAGDRSPRPSPPR